MTSWWCRIGYHDWYWVGVERFCTRCGKPLEDEEDV